MGSEWGRLFHPFLRISSLLAQALYTVPAFLLTPFQTEKPKWVPSVNRLTFLVRVPRLDLFCFVFFLFSSCFRVPLKCKFVYFQPKICRHLQWQARDNCTESAQVRNTHRPLLIRFGFRLFVNRLLAKRWETEYVGPDGVCHFCLYFFAEKFFCIPC